MEIAEEHDEHFSSVIRFERRFSKYAEYKSPRNVKITAQPQMCMCASDHPALETKWLDDTFGTSGYAIAPDNTGRWYDGCDQSLHSARTACASLHVQMIVASVK